MNSDNRVVKLYPWLEKAKKNITTSDSLLKELERIKVLDVRTEKITVDVDTYALLKEFKKKRARFVNADGKDETEVEP